MAQETDDIRTDVGPEPAALREQMEETRTALTDKLETLQERVLGTVESAQATVEQTVAAVKETVQDTVTTIRRTLDLPHQVRQRPWLLVGASVLAGYALSRLGRHQRPQRVRARAEATDPEVSPRFPVSIPAEALRPGPAEGPQPTAGASALAGLFEEELGMVQKVAVGAAMGVLRDWLKQTVPTLAPQLDQVMNSATCKLGGQPIEGPLFRHAENGTGVSSFCDNQTRSNS